MEFKDGYRFVADKDEIDPLAQEVLHQLPDGSYLMGNLFSRQDQVYFERQAFLHRIPIESVFKDNAASNMKRIEAFKDLVGRIMDANPDLHDVHDIRDLPGADLPLPEKFN